MLLELGASETWVAETAGIEYWNLCDDKADFTQAQEILEDLALAR